MEVRENIETDVLVRIGNDPDHRAHFFSRHLILTCYFAHDETHPSRRYFGWNRHVYLDIDRAHGPAARRSRHPRNSESTGGPGRHANQHWATIRPLPLPWIRPRPEPDP